MCAIEVNRLRIEPAGETLVNEYRVEDGMIELRLLDRAGRPCPGPLGTWRPLDENDIALHHALGTVVSKWLQVRFGETRPEELVLEDAA